VPAIADYCGVDLLDDNGLLERVAAAHRDPARKDLVARLQTIERHLPDRGRRPGAWLLTGTSELYDEITADQLVATSRSDSHLALIRELGSSRWRSCRCGSRRGRSGS